MPPRTVSAREPPRRDEGVGPAKARDSASLGVPRRQEPNKLLIHQTQRKQRPLRSAQYENPLQPASPGVMAPSLPPSKRRAAARRLRRAVAWRHALGCTSCCPRGLRRVASPTRRRRPGRPRRPGTGPGPPANARRSPLSVGGCRAGDRCGVVDRAAFFRASQRGAAPAWAGGGPPVRSDLWAGGGPPVRLGGPRSAGPAPICGRTRAAGDFAGLPSPASAGSTRCASAGAAMGAVMSRPACLLVMLIWLTGWVCAGDRFGGGVTR